MREDFTYDRLNRLTGIVEDGDTTARFDYDAYGRMLRKYMHSALVFDSASYNADNRPHAIEQAQTPLDLPLHRMRYTHFDKLAFLMQDTLAVDYIYGYEHQRLHMTEASIYGDTLIEKEYVDNCEYIDNDLYTTTLTYLSGPLGVFGVQEKRDGYRPDCYFIHPDHLGSWTLVTDSYANIRQDVMYDAWGTPYGFDETDTTALVPVQSLLFDRGFTGHEHLLYFGLINMNGRLYDPVLGRMLSPDIATQDEHNAQAYNRYSYCFNNPLRFTDPSGYFVDWYEKNGRIIWDDKVTCPENTPQGGTYIGPDILNYLNVPSAFEIVKETKFGVSLNGVLGETDHNGVLYPNQNIGLVPTVPVDYVSGSLWVDVKTVDYSTDEASGTSHNIKVFSELVLNFGFTQSCNTMDFKGGACVYCKDETYYERLTPMDPSISQIQATGTDFKKASIVIPADRIKSPDYFIEANIRAGSPQSSMFVNPTIVDMKWNLRKRVTLNSL